MKVSIKTIVGYWDNARKTRDKMAEIDEKNLADLTKESVEDAYNFAQEMFQFFDGIIKTENVTISGK